MSELAWGGLTWALCVMAALGILGHTVSHRSQTLIVVATGAHYLMALSVPAVVLSVFATTSAGARAAGIVVSLALMVAAAALHYPLYRRRRPPSGDGRVLSVLTSNLLLGRAQPAAVVDLLRSENIEVFLAQELTESERAALAACGIDELFPHAVLEAAEGGSGTGIWSRYPITGGVSHADFGFRVLSARLQLDESPGPTVWSVHLQPPWPRPPAGWLVDLPRLQALLAAVPRAAGAADAVIVGGDFNATWNHRQFRRLRSSGYDDAAVLSGSGALLSWPADRPGPALIGLDHILLRSARVDSVRTVRVAGSDHLAVLGRIVLSG